MNVTSNNPHTAVNAVAPWLSGSSIDNVSLGHTVSCMAVRAYGEHEHLYVEGEKQSHVYLVVEGVVAMYKLLADGRRQITTFAYPGDMVGLDSVGIHVNNAEALVDSKVRCIPVNAIEKLIRTEPGFGQALLFLTASELAETREQLLALGRKSAAEKLATFLLRIARRSAVVEGEFEQMLVIPMKRCEIADFLGLTIETVSRTFTRLKVAEVIRLKSNSEVVLLDVEKLEAIANGGINTFSH